MLHPQQQPRQQVVALPLSQSVRQKLLAAGFRTVADLEGVKALELATAAGLSPEEALLVLKSSCRSCRTDGGIAGAVSAVDLYESEAVTPRIITFCPGLDSMLGGGVHAGQVTEFAGVPAVGKTQLGIQLAVDVQIPPAFGGIGGEAIFIDTEGSLVTDRVVDIASACLAHLRKIAAQQPARPARQEAVQQMSVESLLAGITYFRCRDVAELLAAVNLLPGFVQAHPKVRLVVVDSIAYHFRHEYSGDPGGRSRMLAGLAADLMALAAGVGGRGGVPTPLAVVLMNQATTQVGSNADGPAEPQGGTDGGSISKLVPALGDSWAHAATNRVILYWQGGERHAYLYKSPSQPAGSAEYLVTPEGIRGKRPPKRPRPIEDTPGLRQQQQQQQNHYQ